MMFITMGLIKYKSFTKEFKLKISKLIILVLLWIIDFIFNYFSFASQPFFIPAAMVLVACLFIFILLKNT